MRLEFHKETTEYIFRRRLAVKTEEEGAEMA